MNHIKGYILSAIGCTVLKIHSEMCQTCSDGKYFLSIKSYLHSFFNATLDHIINESVFFTLLTFFE